MSDARGMLQYIAPVFRVADLARSIAFYRDRLGFEVEFNRRLNDRLTSPFALTVSDHPGASRHPSWMKEGNVFKILPCVSV